MTTSIRSEAARSVIVVNGVDVLRIYPDGTLESPQNKLPFSVEFQSAQLTFVASTRILVNHTLGAKPKFVVVEATCIAVDGTFAVGDCMVATPYTWSDAGPYRGFALDISATQIGIRVAPQILFYTTTNANNTIDLTKWRFVVRAWR